MAAIAVVPTWPAVAAGSTPAAAHRVTFHVFVGGMVPGNPHVDLQSFYLRTSVIHVGDRIEFDFRGLHTASLVPPGMRVPQPVR